MSDQLPMVVAQLLLDDMHNNSKLLQRLEHSIGYDEGYNAGYLDGQRAAQRRMRTAMSDLQAAAGIGYCEGEP